MKKSKGLRKIMAILLTITLSMSMINMSVFADVGDSESEGAYTSNESMQDDGAQETNDHVHGDECFNTSGDLICGKEERSNSDGSGADERNGESEEKSGADSNTTSPADPGTPEGPGTGDGESGTGDPTTNKPGYISNGKGALEIDGTLSFLASTKTLSPAEWKYVIRIDGPGLSNKQIILKNQHTVENIDNLTPGKYRVIYSTVKDYDLTMTVDGQEIEKSDTNDTIVEVEPDKTTNVTIVYTPNSGTLNLTDKVVGSSAAEKKEYTYTIKGAEQSYTVSTAGINRSTTRKTITKSKKLPTGEYELIAGDDQVDGYTVKTEISQEKFSINMNGNYDPVNITVTHTYTRGEPVAKSGDKEYYNFQEAVDDVGSGGTVEILRDMKIGTPVHVTKDVTLTSVSGENVTLTRSSDNEDNMFVVDNGGNLKLENITLDGGSGEGLAPIRAIAKVNTGGTLELDSGAVLQNNYLAYNKEWMKGMGGYRGGQGKSTSDDDLYNGGGVFVDGGTMTMFSGAVIRNCKAHNGGGVLAQYGTFQMNDGALIENNVADFHDGQVTSSSGVNFNFNIGCGGGVLITGDAMMNFEGGTIRNNSAGFGGGIAEGTERGMKYINPNIGDQLVMDGSACLVTDNKAAANGGGIFVGWGTIANVKAGKITYNECAIDEITYTGPGRPALYGGGGIYVQGDEKYSGMLKIRGVEITGNNAALNGGGIAGCPYSNVGIHFDGSGVIYGNNDGGAIGGQPLQNPGEEVYITPHSYDDISHPEVRFSPFMAGGGAYNWTDKNGKHVYYEMLNLTLNEKDGAVSLYNALTADSEGVQKAESMNLITVEISGNISHAGGGGIGTNGTVEVGNENKKLEETIDLSVQKIWKDNRNEDSRPGSITFTLYQNGNAIEQYVMTPDGSGQWPTEAVKAFKSLPKYDLSDYSTDPDYEPKEYTYEIREEAVSYYKGSGENTGDVWIFTNTYTPEPTPSVTPEVTPSITPEVTPSITPEVTPRITPVVTPSATPEPTPSDTPEPTPSDTPEPTPSDTPEPTPTDIPDTTPPLAETPTPEPTETPTRNIPEPTVPLTEKESTPTPSRTVVTNIPQSNVPMASMPGTSTQQIEEIEDTAVPLGDAPQTGDNSPLTLWAVLMIASLLGIAAIRMYLTAKRRTHQGR